MNNNYVLYAIVVFSVVIFAWTVSGTFQNSVGSTKFNYYQAQAQQSGSECGDMKDVGNVQHLSHHPDRFANCIKQVDPQIFEKAVGQSKEEYMKEKGIQ